MVIFLVLLKLFFLKSKVSTHAESCLLKDCGTEELNMNLSCIKASLWQSTFFLELLALCFRIISDTTQRISWTKCTRLSMWWTGRWMWSQYDKCIILIYCSSWMRPCSRQNQFKSFSIKSVLRLMLWWVCPAVLSWLCWKIWGQRLTLSRIHERDRQMYLNEPVSPNNIVWLGYRVLTDLFQGETETECTTLSPSRGSLGISRGMKDKGPGQRRVASGQEVASSF